MAVLELTEFDAFNNEQLRVKWHSKEYAIPPVGIADALLVQRAMAGDEKAMAEWDEGDRSYRIFLGSSYDEMVADNAPIPFVERAHLMALTNFRRGPIAAAKAWEVGHDPESLASLMEAIHLIMTQKDTTGVEDSSTKPPDSGSSTTSPRRTRNAPSKASKGSRSPGPKSVSTGG